MQGGKQPGPDHPISVESADVKIIVRIGDTILAESSNALILREARLPPVFYIPREDVAMETLTPSATRTYCPYKGDASYFSARDGAAKDVAWSYEEPFDQMLIIKRHLAFYPDRVDAIEKAPHDRDRHWVARCRALAASGQRSAAAGLCSDLRRDKARRGVITACSHRSPR